MNDFGIVMRVLEPGLAQVKIGRAEACEHCGASGMCGVKDMEMEAHYSVTEFPDVEEGDIVRIDMSSKGGLKAAFLMYLLPLLAFGAALAVTIVAGGEEWHGLLAGLAAMALVYIVIAMNNNRFKKDKDYIGHIISVRKIEPAEDFKVIDE